MENDLLEIADDTDRDYREGKNGKDIPNKEQMLRSKIRIESRQWLMSRRDPQQWGDRQSVDVSANIMLLSPEERMQKALALFDLMEKFVERARKPVGGGPLVYDPGDDSLPLLVVEPSPPPRPLTATTRPPFSSRRVWRRLRARVREAHRCL